MFRTWFQKKATPVRVEIKRRSIRLYPPMPGEDSTHILPAAGNSVLRIASSPQSHFQAR